MKNWVICIFFLPTLLLFTQCGSGENYKELDQDYRMKLLQFSDFNKKINPPCYVQFRWLLCQELDTITDERLFIKVDSIYPTHGITESLSLLNEGESALFQTLGKWIELEFDEILKQKSISIQKEKTYTHLLQIERIYNEFEFENEKVKFIEWISAQHELGVNTVEEEIIANFLDRNEPRLGKLEKSKSGLYYKISPSLSGIKTGFGKKVKIKYKGGVLDQPQQHQEVEQDFRIGEELQVIRAIEEILLYMEQGDSAIIIAPSKLAFGEKGSSTGLIPPATPIYYELVLNEISSN